MLSTSTRRAARRRIGAFLPVICLAAVSAGCWNGDVQNVRLGDVSLGSQLIDLKQALAEEAIDEEEYLAAKEKLIALYAICESNQQEE